MLSCYIRLFKYISNFPLYSGQYIILQLVDATSIEPVSQEIGQNALFLLFLISTFFATFELFQNDISCLSVYTILMKYTVSSIVTDLNRYIAPFLSSDLAN